MRNVAINASFVAINASFSLGEEQEAISGSEL